MTTCYVHVGGFRGRVAATHCFACILDISPFLFVSYSDFCRSGGFRAPVGSCRVLSQSDTPDERLNYVIDLFTLLCSVFYACRILSNPTRLVSGTKFEGQNSNDESSSKSQIPKIKQAPILNGRSSPNHQVTKSQNHQIDNSNILRSPDRLDYHDF